MQSRWCIEMNRLLVEYSFDSVPERLCAPRGGFGRTFMCLPVVAPVLASFFCSTLFGFNVLLFLMSFRGVIRGVISSDVSVVSFMPIYVIFVPGVLLRRPWRRIKGPRILGGHSPTQCTRWRDIRSGNSGVRVCLWHD